MSWPPESLLSSSDTSAAASELARDLRSGSGTWLSLVTALGPDIQPRGVVLLSEVVVCASSEPPVASSSECALLAAFFAQRVSSEQRQREAALEALLALSQNGTGLEDDASADVARYGF